MNIFKLISVVLMGSLISCSESISVDKETVNTSYTNIEIDSIVSELENYYGPDEKWKHTAEVYTDLINHNADKCELYYKRAIAYSLSRNYSESIKDYSHKLDNCTDVKDKPEILEGRGESYQFNKELDNAYDDYTRAIEITFDSGRIAYRAYLNRGTVHMEKKNYLDPISDFTMVIDNGIGREVKADAYYYRAISKIKSNISPCRDLEKARSSGILIDQVDELILENCTK